MKIAVYHNLPSGGGKRTVFETVRRLAQRHIVDVYTLSTADHAFCDLRPVVHQHHIFEFQPLRLFHSPFGRLNQLQRWRDLWRLDRLARQIALEINTQSYDVVFAQPCMWTQAPLIIRYLRVPTVYCCQEPPRAIYEPVSCLGNGSMGWRAALDRVDPLIPLYRSTARRLDWEATRAAQVVLVNSKFMRDTVARIYGVVPLVSYHGVDTDVFRPLPEVERRGYVLSVGAIDPRKGFAFLIESLGCLPETARPSLRLVGNVGVNGERQLLEALATQQGVDLHIEVGVDQETLVRRYNEAALLAYAPHNEPFGLVPLEAMACGTPVVGVAEGGVLETVLDGVTGRLVQRDREEFAMAIAELLVDPKKRQCLGEQAMMYVFKHWTWDAAVGRVEEHLCRAIQGATEPALPGS